MKELNEIGGLAQENNFKFKNFHYFAFAFHFFLIFIHFIHKKSKKWYTVIIYFIHFSSFLKEKEKNWNEIMNEMNEKDIFYLLNEFHCFIYLLIIVYFLLSAQEINSFHFISLTPFIDLLSPHSIHSISLHSIGS